MKQVMYHKCIAKQSFCGLLPWQPLRGWYFITRNAGPHRAMTNYTGLRIHVNTENGEFRPWHLCKEHLSVGDIQQTTPGSGTYLTNIMKIKKWNIIRLMFTHSVHFIIYIYIDIFLSNYFSSQTVLLNIWPTGRKDCCRLRLSVHFRPFPSSFLHGYWNSSSYKPTKFARYPAWHFLDDIIWALWAQSTFIFMLVQHQ